MAEISLIHLIQKLIDPATEKTMREFNNLLQN